MLLLSEKQFGLSAEQQLAIAYRLTLTQEENEALKTENTTLKAENATLQEENKRLQEQLALAQHRHFGKKSEVGEPIVGDATALISVSAHTRRKKSKGRLIDLSRLPRHTIIHDLADGEKIVLVAISH